MKTINEIRYENFTEILNSEASSLQNIADKMNKSNAQMSHIKNKVKNIGDKVAREFEVAFDKPHGWMDVSHDSNIREVDIRGEKVPVISWVAAGNFCAISDPYLPGTADRWLPCPVPHSKSAYALVVTGLSMYNPIGKPSFEDGDVIFVDPEIAPRNKSCVIVRLDDKQEATFKQLIIEAGSQYLVPLNPDWPEKFIEVAENATICGVVIGKWVDI